MSRGRVRRCEQCDTEPGHAATERFAPISSRVVSTFSPKSRRTPRQMRRNRPKRKRGKARARLPSRRRGNSRSAEACLRSTGSVSVRPPPPTRRKHSFGAESADFTRIVLDEAHLIKSRTTLNAKASYALKGTRRWALTGTPIVKQVLQSPFALRILSCGPQYLTWI